MIPRRNKKKLEEAVAKAKSSNAQAIAFYNLALFHDNNSREVEAIPNYEKALKLGLPDNTKTEALAWLASSLYKTGQPKKALQKIQASRQDTNDKKLVAFLNGLEKRVKGKTK